jgi:hypothetical protein
MLEMGADIVKVFPAGTLGPKYVKDIQAPLNPMPIMVVGGVNGDNCQEFFDEGASYAGIGSGIFEPEAHRLDGRRGALKADPLPAFEHKGPLVAGADLSVVRGGQGDMADVEFNRPTWSLCLTLSTAIRRLRRSMANQSGRARLRQEQLPSGHR